MVPAGADLAEFLVPARTDLAVKLLRRGPGDQCDFMNSCVHHYLKIASSTAQNCGFINFIFDDIASLAGSADAQDVNPCWNPRKWVRT